MATPSAPPEEYDDQAITKKVYTALTNKSGLMGTTATIEGIEIESFFDTGAEISIMALETALKYGFEIMPSKMQIKVADNSVKNAIGQTKHLQVHLGESLCKISFVIMKHDDHPILLGLDWFSCSGASLNPSENTITFPRRIVFLNNTNIMKREILNEIEEPNEGRLNNLLEQDDNLGEFGIDPDEKKDIIVETNCIFTESQVNEWQIKLKPLIQDRCSTGTNDIGYFTGDLLEIELSSQLPINRPVFRRSQAENDEMEKQNTKLLKAGIIEESTSPYNNNVMGMKKANGKIRVVNDFRGIHEIMIPLNFPIMIASTIFDLVAGSEIFSVTDMSSGFWQC